MLLAAFAPGVIFNDLEDRLDARASSFNECRGQSQRTTTKHAVGNNAA